MKGLADANQWYKLHEPSIQARQNIERMKKREENYQKANAALAE